MLCADGFKQTFEAADIIYLNVYTGGKTGTEARTLSVLHISIYIYIYIIFMKSFVNNNYALRSVYIFVIHKHIWINSLLSLLYFLSVFFLSFWYQAIFFAVSVYLSDYRSVSLNHICKKNGKTLTK